MADTITLPLTSVFTPPTSCTSQWTYEAEYYNSVSGGLLLQNALDGDGIASACFPSGFANNGRIPSAQVFSPGTCPSGYTIPVISIGGAITTEICCQTGFSYSTTYSTVDHFTSLQSLLFAGCVSTYPSESGPTQVVARSGDSQLESTTITGPITMWGQAITVEFQQHDLSLFAPSTPPSASSTSSMASPLAGPSTPPVSTSATSATTSNSVGLTTIWSVTTAPSTTGNSIATATTSAVQDTVLSPGSQIGISIGSAAAFILLLGIILLLFRRRQKHRRNRSASAKVLELGADQQGSNRGMYQDVLLEAPDGTIPPRELHGQHTSIQSRHARELQG